MNGAVEDKILAPLAGVPALLHSVRAFAKSGVAQTLVFVCKDETQREKIRALADTENLGNAGMQTFFCIGGKERRDSVLNGLRLATQANVSANALAFIHDCARPLVRENSLRELAETATREGAAVLAHRCVNTVKRVPANAVPGHACEQEDLERARLWETETPQVFPLAKILAAYEKIAKENIPTTDDVAAFDAPVALVENPFPNPKITVATDLALISILLGK